MATVALLNGKTLGFGAPPAREMRDGGDFCINSARVKGKKTWLQFDYCNTDHIL